MNSESRNIKDPQYKALFKALGGTLPCIFCRISYKQFYKELNIDKYLGRKKGLMRFVYDLKNKVNEKLLKQEQELALKKSKDLEKCKNEASKLKLMKEIQDIFYTKPAPPFEQVYQEYAQHKAKCNKTLKTCRKKLKNK